MCRIPPPPAHQLVRDLREFRRSKKVSDSPPLISFFGTCSTFEAGGGPRKKHSVLCPPFFEILDPPLLLCDGLLREGVTADRHWWINSL